MLDDANNPADAPELAGQDAPTETRNEAPDDAPEAGNEQTTPEVETFEADIDGEKYVLPAKLRDKFLMQSDFTRKTTELAREREQFEAYAVQEKARIQTDASTFETRVRVAALDEQLKQYANVDWNALTQSDASAAQQHFMRYQQLRDARAQMQGEIDRHEQQRAMREFSALQAAQEEVARAIPKWGPDVAKELQSVAKSLGATDAEVKSIRAPWVVRALYAQKQMQDMAAKAAKPATPAVKPVAQVAGGAAKGAVDPDKESIDDYMRRETKRLARMGRR